MIQIKTAILDDNKQDATKVSQYFKNLNSKELQYVCDEYETLPYDFYEGYDLYILDIELKDMSGLEVAQKVRKKNSNAVLLLCSKRNDLVFESFKLGCFFFIRKDHFEKDMKDAQKRLDEYFNHSKKCYVYHSAHQIYPIAYDKIEFIEKIGHQIEIHLENQDILKERKTLKEIIDEIKSPMFIQCHQSYYVNLSKVLKMENEDFVLPTCRVQISKRYLSQVKKEYMKYLSSRI